MIKHRETHPNLDDPDCFGCRISGISFAAAAMPTRRAGVNATEATQRQWDKDIPQYRALRAQGLQPKSVDGCDELAAIARDDHVINGVPRLAPHMEDVLCSGAEALERMGIEPRAPAAADAPAEVHDLTSDAA